MKYPREAKCVLKFNDFKMPNGLRNVFLDNRVGKRCRNLDFYNILQQFYLVPVKRVIK